MLGEPGVELAGSKFKNNNNNNSATVSMHSQSSKYNFLLFLTNPMLYALRLFNLSHQHKAQISYHLL